MKAAALTLPAEISAPTGSTTRAWLELMRPPNLFTVPGDPLVGFFLASLALKSAPSFYCVLPCIAASFLLYISGLLFNDFFDREIDAKERPARPIPSGRANAKSVLAAAIFSMLAGVAVSYLSGIYVFYVAAALAFLVLLYNGGIKHVPFLGPLNMGLCRGFSVLLGGAAVSGLKFYDSSSLEMVALFITVYIFSVTRIAATETIPDKKRDMPVIPTVFSIFIPAIVYVDIYAGRLPVVSYQIIFSLVIALTGFFWIVINSLKVRDAKSPGDVQKAVGNLIRGLLPVQAALCALFFWQGLVVAVILILFFPLSSLAAKKFYAS